MVRNWLEARPVYKFDGFKFDPAAPSLRHSGADVPLTPKVLQTLQILIEHRDRVISKEEFFQLLWPGLHVDENSLAQNIYLLRKTLKEREPDRDYIENVPKRGYRFAGNVRIARVRVRSLLVVVASLIVCLASAGILWRSSTARTQGTANEEAYNLYLLGRAIWTKRDPARMDQAFHYLRQAVDKDPQFALGWAALADLHAFDFYPAAEARRAAEWALVLDPKLAEPYTTMGFIEMIHDWDWPAAERYFQKSIALNPRYATARQWYGLYLTLSGRFADAENQIREGLRLDPISINLLNQRCVMLYFAKEYQTALTECGKVLELDPVFPFAHDFVMKLQARLGNYEWLVEHYSGAREALRKGGRAGYWRLVIAELNPQGGDFLKLAAAYAELADTERAFDALRRAVETHEFRSVYACADPVFDPLRKDRRFEQILQKVCGSRNR